jgi:hypothetical protein
MRRVRIDAYDSPAWTHCRGEQIEDARRAAAEIDRALTASQADPSEQFLGVRPEFLGLTPEPGRLVRVAAKRVDVHLRLSVRLLTVVDCRDDVS